MNQAINTAVMNAEIRIEGEMKPGYAEILNGSALEFVAALVKQVGPELNELLAERENRQRQYDGGELPGFREDTRRIRENESWQIAAMPGDLQDRRVEITGPTDRKMVINALNSGARVFMCCFEDATAPTWENMIDGQINLRDANRGTISAEDPQRGKQYRLNEQPAVLMARPRGLHLPENCLTLNGKAIPGCLVDFGLYFLHNYRARLSQGSGVYYYLPKLESMEEARWWSKVFDFTESYFGVPTGSIRASVLIETLPAVFQMDEILYALRQHITAINCGRWDYIFSYIKRLRAHPDRVLPDRSAITMETPFLNACSRLLIRTAHRRGALAIGGMAALIPSRDPQQMSEIIQKVVADKSQEAGNGHDGSWVAHPDLVAIAMTVFDRQLGDQPNQLHQLRPGDGEITAGLLLSPCEGPRSEAGLRENIRVSLQYLAAWISGRGCIPIGGLMEDAATAEISRTSIWQWIHHQVVLDDGRTVTRELFRDLLVQEYVALRRELGAELMISGRYQQACSLLDELATEEPLCEFLTLRLQTLLS